MWWRSFLHQPYLLAILVTSLLILVAELVHSRRCTNENEPTFQGIVAFESFETERRERVRFGSTSSPRKCNNNYVRSEILEIFIDILASIFMFDEEYHTDEEEIDRAFSSMANSRPDAYINPYIFKEFGDKAYEYINDQFLNKFKAYFHVTYGIELCDSVQIIEGYSIIRSSGIDSSVSSQQCQHNNVTLVGRFVFEGFIPGNYISGENILQFDSKHVVDIVEGPLNNEIEITIRLIPSDETSTIDPPLYLKINFINGGKRQTIPELFDNNFEIYLFNVEKHLMILDENANDGGFFVYFDDLSEVLTQHFYETQPTFKVRSSARNGDDSEHKVEFNRPILLVSWPVPDRFTVEEKIGYDTYGRRLAFQIDKEVIYKIVDDDGTIFYEEKVGY